MLKSFYYWLKSKFQFDEDYVKDKQSSYIVDQRILAFWVGLIAIFLPLVMLASSAFGVIPRQTLSHYYYVPIFGGIFMISLAFIGTFLVSYRGVNALESKLTTFAGWCAYCIALFPTSGLGFDTTKAKVKLFTTIDPNSTEHPEHSVSIAHEKIANAFELTSTSECIHLTAAGFFFGFLAIYSLFIFTQSVDGVSRIDGKLTKIKLGRNTIYYLSGGLIILSIVAIAAHKIFGLGGNSWDNHSLTFWFEAIGLIAFGIAWMVKSRFRGIAMKDPTD